MTDPQGANSAVRGGLGAAVGGRRLKRTLVFERVLIYAAAGFGIIGPGFGFVQTGPLKLYPFRVLLPAVFVLFAIRTLSSRFPEYVRSPSVKRFLWFLAAWWTYAVGSTLWAADKGLAVQNILLLSVGITLEAVIVYYIGSMRQLRRLCDVWLLVSALAMAVGVWETVTGDHLAVSGYVLEENYLSRFSPSAFFYNKNDLATFIALTVPFALVWMFHARRRGPRFMCAVLLVASAYVLVQTKSRGSALAVVLELGCLYVFRRPYRSAWRLAVAVAVFLLLGVSVWVGIDTTGEEGLLARFSELREDLAPDSVRYNLYRNVPWFVLRSYGLGVGAGNAEYHLEHQPLYDTYGYYNVHNWWLEIVTNYGLPVFFLYVYFYLKLGGELIRTQRRSRTATGKMVGRALVAGWIGFSVASLSSSSIMPFVPQWLFWGVALAYLNVSAASGVDPRRKAPRPRTVERLAAAPSPNTG